MNAQLEPIARTEDRSICSRRIAKSRFDHPLHYHPEIEITSIVQSRGTCVVGDYIGNFKEGDLFLIGENLQHMFTNTFKAKGNAEAEVLQFSRDFSNGFLDATPELLAFTRLLDQARFGILFDRKTALRAVDMLVRIRQASSLDRIRGFMDLIDCLVNAQECTVLASPGYVGDSNAQDSLRMQIALRYILENFSDEISHQALAAKVHLAPASFCRLFKKLTSKTCTSFINEIRLGHACRLLMEGESSVTEIAYASGFKNLSNFNRRFKERYHLSPRQYRKQIS